MNKASQQVTTECRQWAYDGMELRLPTAEACWQYAPSAPRPTFRKQQVHARTTPMESQQHKLHLVKHLDMCSVCGLCVQDCQW